MSVGLAIFVKTPGHSPIKTRLAATQGSAFAEACHRRAAAAVAAVCSRAEAEGLLHAHWAVAENVAAARAQWTGLPVLGQGEGGLGERMQRVHQGLVERFHGGLLVGADAPQIGIDHLRLAAGWLRPAEPRCVLGPAADGGFWLFGANRAARRELWTSVRYSAPDTARQFQQAMQQLGAWLMLPTLTDLDQAEDLEPVAAELRALAHPLPEQRALLDWMGQHESA